MTECIIMFVINQIMTDLSGLSQTWKKLTKLIGLDKSQLFQAILNLLTQREFSVALECSYLYEIYALLQYFFLMMKTGILGNKPVTF